MLAPMPSDDLLPLAPFPEVTSAPAAAGDLPEGEPSLLSAAQRRELTMAADSLSGRGFPQLEADPVSVADDFLLGPAMEGLTPDGFDVPASPRAEEPPPPVDFLDVNGGASVPAVVPVESFSLQSLAASLAAPAPAPTAPRRRDDWEPPAVPAFPSLTGMSPVAATSTGPATPISRTAGGEKKEGFFVPLPVFPPPRALELEPDFDAPLLFPVPSAERHAEPRLEEETDPHDRALGAILCGALLLVLGLFLACRVPSLALEADAAAGGGHTVRAGHLRGEMFVSIAGAAACLLLGIGATTLRRWAPPLIHAAGWTVLLTVLCGMAVATASMFHLSSNNTPGDAVPGDGTAIFAIAGIFGVALPLLLIAIFQRPGVAKLCAFADKRQCWTDRRSIPALMVFISGAMLAAAVFALSIAQSAFPAFGHLNDGSGAWAGIGLAAAAAGGLAAAGHKAGWWLLTGLTCALAAAIFLTCRQHAWQEIFGLTAVEPPTTGSAILAAAVLLPLLLIVLMTRRAFAHQAAA